MNTRFVRNSTTGFNALAAHQYCLDETSCIGLPNQMEIESANEQTSH
jgi:hypothetical protein